MEILTAEGSPAPCTADLALPPRLPPLASPSHRPPHTMRFLAPKPHPRAHWGAGQTPVGWMKDGQPEGGVEGQSRPTPRSLQITPIRPQTVRAGCPARPVTGRITADGAGSGGDPGSRGLSGAHARGPHPRRRKRQEWAELAPSQQGAELPGLLGQAEHARSGETGVVVPCPRAAQHRCRCRCSCALLHNVTTTATKFRTSEKQHS